ncbi:MAG: hypothetical protein MZV63_43760 [Marinilabiliales bacterium]|nr:hypothetical protein [Marinilabiliales bacterium]
MDVVVIGNFDIYPREIAPQFYQGQGHGTSFSRGLPWMSVLPTRIHPISLLQGEYRLYTSKMVDRPAFLTGIQDQYADKEIEGILFDIYPNPFSEQTVIRFTGENEYQPHTVEVFSAKGARVRCHCCSRRHR